MVGKWNAEDIDNTEKRLNEIRDEMRFRILIDIRRMVGGSQSDEHRRMLSTLESITNGLAEHREDSKVMMEKLNRINDSIMGLELNVYAPSASRAPSPGLAAEHSSNVLDEQARKQAEDAILYSLWYPSIGDREEGITEAYPKTLNWIYEDPDIYDESRKRDSFADFLRGETTVYWITGKAGSGKSTLMKFINEQPQTQELLQQWAGAREPVNASFYFFYNGKDEQKSEFGMLSSLLHSILSKRRDLIPVAFEERVRTVLQSRRHAGITVPEAKRALKKLFQGSAQIRFFLTVDGLDEFDPKVSSSHVTSLITLTKLLGGFDNVKVVVSSRPLIEFEEGFAAYPHLKVHDITKGDIEHYVQDRLEKHRHMKILLRRDPIQSKNLIDTIVSLSSGVFLWVRVVADSLLEGLRNGDSLSDLQKRVEGLPPDLHDLYSVILQRVEPAYRSQTCKLLQWAYCGTRNRPLSALELWFAERADRDMVFQTETKPISDEDMRDRIDEMESRLKSRCLGLVEIRPSGRIIDYPIGFLHKTVSDFLKGNAWKQFINTQGETGFEPYVSLLYGTILVIKAFRFVNDTKAVSLWHIVTNALIWALRIENSASSDLLHELDSTVTTLLADRNVIAWSHTEDDDDKCVATTSPWSKLFALAEPGVHINKTSRIDLRKVDMFPSFLAVATFIGLKNYLAEQIKIHGSSVLATKGFPLLGHAIWRNGHPDIVQMLLENGCNPKEIYAGVSVWGWFWRNACDNWTRDKVSFALLFFRDGSKIMRMMVAAGAEPNIIIPWVICTGYNQEDMQWNYCTPLMALGRMHSYCSDTRGYRSGNDRYELLNIIESLVELFKERGGIEKEWPHDHVWDEHKPEPFLIISSSTRRSGPRAIYTLQESDGPRYSLERGSGTPISQDKLP